MNEFIGYVLAFLGFGCWAAAIIILVRISPFASAMFGLGMINGFFGRGRRW